MTDTSIKDYIIGLIMFTFIVVGGIALVGELKLAQPTFGDTDDDKFTRFNETFNQFNDVTSSIDTLEGSTQDNPDPGSFGMLNALITGSWNTLKNLFTTFAFMDTIFEGLYTFFGIPSWATTLILGVITIVIVFRIFGAIFQRSI